VTKVTSKNLHSTETNFGSAKNVGSSNAVEFEFELRHIATVRYITIRPLELFQIPAVRYNMTWYDIVYLRCSKKTVSFVHHTEPTEKKYRKNELNKSWSMVSPVRSGPIVWSQWSGPWPSPIIGSDIYNWANRNLAGLEMFKYLYNIVYTQYHLMALCLCHPGWCLSLVAGPLSRGSPPLPPVGHIWDVMLFWRKGNINENCLCLTVVCSTKIRAVLTGRLTVCGRANHLST